MIAEGMNRKDLEDMIDTKLKNVTDTITHMRELTDTKLAILSKKVDDFLAAITNMGIANNRHERDIEALRSKHEYHEQNQNTSITILQEKIIGLQTALTTIRESIPDQKTVKEIEEKSKTNWQKMVWLIAIAGAILSALFFLGEIYLENRQMKKQLDQLIIDEPRK